MFNQKKQNRMTVAIRSKIRNFRYQLRKSTNTIAALMVLFLTLIAAILYLNEQEQSEKERTKTVLLQISPCPTANTEVFISITPITATTNTGTRTSSLSYSASPSPVATSALPVPSTSKTTATLAPTPEAALTRPLPPTEISGEAPSPPMLDIRPATTPTATEKEPLPSPTPAVTAKLLPATVITPSAKPVAPTASPAMTPPPQKTALKKVLVVIDPGHGGKDPGTCSIYQENLYEKDINLDICLKLKTLLQNTHIPMLMTRESDVEVFQTIKGEKNENISERPGIANRNNATLFVSIHVNAYDTKLPGGERHHGTEVYHAGKTHGAFTSKQFADMMGKAIDKKTDTRYNGVLKKNFAVLRLSDMPALLVETAYLTNKEDHERLESDAFRSAMAEGIHDGILDILETMGASKMNDTWCILDD